MWKRDDTCKSSKCIVNTTISKYAITMKLDRQKQKRLANITQNVDERTTM